MRCSIFLQHHQEIQSAVLNKLSSHDGDGTRHLFWIHVDTVAAILLQPSLHRKGTIWLQNFIFVERLITVLWFTAPLATSNAVFRISAQIITKFFFPQFTPCNRGRLDAEQTSLICATPTLYGTVLYIGVGSGSLCVVGIYAIFINHTSKNS